MACIATLGSLYFSEVLRHEPCHMCWYQRIAIFPLVIILGIACWRNFFGIVPYVMPLLGFGLVIALYQVLIQELPGWQPIDMCGSGPSCTEKFDIGLGPITIPMLSVGAFAMMMFLLYTARLKRFEKGVNHG